MIKSILKYVGISIVFFILALGFVSLMFYAMEKESQRGYYSHDKETGQYYWTERGV